MKPRLLRFATIVAVSLPLCAQDTRPAQEPLAADAILAMPSAKTEAHGILAAFVGTWQMTCKSEAIPGVAGMEEASESVSTERSRLVCGGLWLESVFGGSFKGEPFEGIWMLGYDPFQKHYVGFLVSNMPETPSVMTASYDAETKTWSFHGTCPQGEMRSTLVMKDADSSVETCYVKMGGGDEVKCSEITRKRVKDAAAAEAAAKTVKAPSEELALLHEGIGDWVAVAKVIMSGAEPMESKCVEQVRPVCNGHWTWSDFNGEMMGMPFEGHAITGYDVASKQYLSYWIDSASATYSLTTGKYDAAKKVFTFEGTCVDPAGKPATIRQISTQKDADTRHLVMSFKGESGSSEMVVDYRRKKR